MKRLLIFSLIIVGTLLLVSILFVQNINRGDTQANSHKYTIQLFT